MLKKYNYTKKTGRPSKLNQELIDKIYKYHDYCIETSEIPYLERLEIQLDISHETVNEWNKEGSEMSKDTGDDMIQDVMSYGYTEVEAREIIADYIETEYDLKIKFSEEIKKIKRLQKLMLQEKLIKSNSIGAMFLLKTVHGYVETSKQINEGNAVVIQVTKTGYIPQVTDAPKQDKPQVKLN